MQRDIEFPLQMTESSCCNLNVEAAVRNRYSAAARQVEPKLCCAVDYDSRYLQIMPREILERDYGCGDPSRYLRPGEVVLDLGSGGGKICYIAAQIVGAQGRVIGVDCNDTMLALARKYQSELAAKLGYANVEFHKGRIQDLKLNLDQLDAWLQSHPARTSADWLQTEAHAQQIRQTTPLIASDSIDVVISNCVLNLVQQSDRQQLFSEIYRVLKRGGRAVISDIVSDEDVPHALQNDSTLWSGCLSGAYREDLFLEAFEAAGFHGIELVTRQTEPWETVAGIEFRSVTVQAFKGKEGPCLERKQAVIYNGPWKAVIDDDGHTLYRGKRMAVCDKTYHLYQQAPYAEDITPIPPAQDIPLAQAQPFDCRKNAVRDPRETKGTPPSGLTLLPVSDQCGPSGCC